MIYFVFGKPRNGKTLWCVSEIIRHLVESDCDIVTNVALKLPDMAEYIDSKYPDNEVDVFKRVTIVDKREASSFFRYRSGGHVMPEFPAIPKETSDSFSDRAEKYFQTLNDEPDSARKGVVYVLDECHVMFSATKWQEHGGILLYYASQHGHLGDCVYLISQSPSFVYKGFRELVEQWHEVRNFYNRSIGIFARKGRFVRRSYYEMPSGRTEPDEKKDFSLDVAGVANCYETRGALGVQTVGGEAKRHAGKKLPWWSVPVAVSLAVVLIGFGIFKLPSFISGYFGDVSEATSGAMGAASEPLGQIATGGQQQSQPRVIGGDQGQHLDTSANPVYPDQRVTVTGVVRRGRRVRVRMSDGTVIDETDEALQRLAPNGVWMDGRKIPIRSARRETVGQMPADFVASEYPHLDQVGLGVHAGRSVESGRFTAQHPALLDSGPAPDSLAKKRPAYPIRGR